MIVPLKRMPLNPNGKIDKPALPFPDTAEAATAESRHVVSSTAQKITSTEQALLSIWAGILPNAPSPIPLNENFFDVGGHSILATRLIFEIRKAFIVNAPLSLVFDYPTVQEQAAELDALRNSDLGLDYKLETPSVPKGIHLNIPNEVITKKSQSSTDYASDYESLLPQLRSEYQRLPDTFATQPLTVFLTGATGFLGAFVLRDLLVHQPRVHKVVALVRATNHAAAVKRLTDGAVDRGAWDERWLGSRLEVVVGDLTQEQFGLDGQTWDRLTTACDVILHNGALVRRV